jgi:hypothetical protein
MGITTVISTITLLAGLIVSGKALISKSEIEQVFLTNEQKIKMYYYKLFSLSGLIALMIGDLLIVWEVTIHKKTASTANWGLAIAVSFIVFIFCLIFLGAVIRVIYNFFIKHYYIYKVRLNEIGDLYILRMMNEEICICSKELIENIDDRNIGQFILVNLSDIIQKPLIKERHLIPQRNIWQKFFD